MTILTTPSDGTSANVAHPEISPAPGTSRGQFSKKSRNDTIVLPFSVVASHVPSDTSERGPLTCLYFPFLRSSNASGGSFHVATYVPINSETATFFRGDWQETPSTTTANAQTRFPFIADISVNTRRPPAAAPLVALCRRVLLPSSSGRACSQRRDRPSPLRSRLRGCHPRLAPRSRARRGHLPGSRPGRRCPPRARRPWARCGRRRSRRRARDSGIRQPRSRSRLLRRWRLRARGARDRREHRAEDDPVRQSGTRASPASRGGLEGRGDVAHRGGGIASRARRRRGRLGGAGPNADSARLEGGCERRCAR